MLSCEVCGGRAPACGYCDVAPLRIRAEKAEREVARLEQVIWNTGVDDLEAKLSIVDGARAEALDVVRALVDGLKAEPTMGGSYRNLCITNRARLTEAYSQALELLFRNEPK